MRHTGEAIQSGVHVINRQPQPFAALLHPLKEVGRNASLARLLCRVVEVFDFLFRQISGVAHELEQARRRGNRAAERTKHAKDRTKTERCCASRTGGCQRRCIRINEHLGNLARTRTCERAGILHALFELRQIDANRNVKRWRRHGLHPQRER